MSDPMRIPKMPRRRGPFRIGQPPDKLPSYEEAVKSRTSDTQSSSSREERLLITLRCTDHGSTKSARVLVTVSTSTTWLQLRSEIKRRILETETMSLEQAFTWVIWQRLRDGTTNFIDEQGWPDQRQPWLYVVPEIEVSVCAVSWETLITKDEWQYERTARSYEANWDRLLAAGRYMPPPKMKPS